MANLKVCPYVYIVVCRQYIDVTNGSFLEARYLFHHTSEVERMEWLQEIVLYFLAGLLYHQTMTYKMIKRGEWSESSTTPIFKTLFMCHIFIMMI